MNNKYKEALDFLSDNITAWGNGSIDLLSSHLDAIEELVERATPKKVTNIHVDEFYCPRCGSEISHDFDCKLPNYCEECGQRLE